MKQSFERRKPVSFTLCVLFSLLLFFSAAFLTENAAAAEKKDDTIGMRLSLSLDGALGSEYRDILSSSWLELFMTRSEASSEDYNFTVHINGIDLVRLFVEPMEDKIAFSLPDVDGKRYETDLPGLIKLLQLDDLISVSGSTPEKEIIIDSFPGSANAPDFPWEEYRKLYGRYLELILNLAENQIHSEEIVDQLPHIGSSIAVTQYTWLPDAQKQAEIFDALADEIEKDEQLAEMVKQWADYLRTMSPYLSTATDEFGESMDMEEAADELEKGFRELPDNLRQTAEKLRWDPEGAPKLSFLSDMRDGTLCRFVVRDDSPNPGMPEIGYESDSHDDETELAVYSDDSVFPFLMLYRGIYNNRQARGNLKLTVSRKPAYELRYDFDLTKRSEIMVPYGSLAFTAGDFGMAFSCEDRKTGSRHSVSAVGTGDFSDDMISSISIFLDTRNGVKVEKPSGIVTDISSYTREQLTELFSYFLRNLLQ